PIHYAWSMYLDDLSLFSHPGIPEGIAIQNQKEINDYSTCVAVLNGAFQGSFKFKAIKERKWRKVQEAFKKNHVVEYCIAYENNRMIGLCDVYFNPKQKHIGLIADFGVLPSYQHRKIGSALLASGIETLREKGCKTINLTVHAENEKALGLYKKFGFYVKKNLTQKTYQII
ncbi:MAG: GNAT family N-acetyltransferase, partial [Candidatus Lokiarchaeota archaeon]|nr:GNAT family N-acetyltransferase [Candidatus Lokiarchaeota archaeon]